MESYKYVFKAMFILAPGALLLYFLGATYIHVACWIGVMCYTELLEINDKLKKQ